MEDEDAAQLAERLPGMQEARGLIPSTAETRCGAVLLQSYYLETGRWEDQMFKVIFSYKAGSRPAEDTGDPVHKQNYANLDKCHFLGKLTSALNFLFSWERRGPLAQGDLFQHYILDGGPGQSRPLGLGEGSSFSTREDGFKVRELWGHILT